MRHLREGSRRRGFDKACTRRSIASMAAVGALALAALTACGGDGGSPAGAAEIWPAETPESLVEAAKKEGEVDWYTVFTEENSAPIVEAFSKAYPGIKVSTLRLSANQLASRIMTEQRGGKFSADVVSGNATYLGQLQKAGAMQGYDIPGLPEAPEGLNLPEGHKGIVYINTTVIAYNPQRLKEEGLEAPTSWEDLTKPEWKGKFSIDPESVDWYDSLVSGMGHEKALELVTALGKNSPRITPNHTQQLTEMQAGETVASATAYGPASASFAEEDPERTAFVNPDPLPAVLTLSGLAKEPPHPAAAKLFLDWLLSPEGQLAVVDGAGKISVREDVENSPKLWNPSTWEPAWADPARDPADYDELTTEFEEAVNP